MKAGGLKIQMDRKWNKKAGFDNTFTISTSAYKPSSPTTFKKLGPVLT